MTVEDRLADLGLTLPEPPAPIGNFVHYVQEGRLVFLSGQGPVQADGTLATGIVGRDVDVETAQQHARDTALVLLSVIKQAAGEFSNVKRIVKLLGMVNAAPGFTEHPRVINGASDLFVALFGDRGRHARAAVGMGSLPGNITVEIEGVVALNGD